MKHEAFCLVIIQECDFSPIVNSAITNPVRPVRPVRLDLAS